MSCPECFIGSIHEGTPKGRETTLHGRDVYVAEPMDGDTQSIKGIIVILSDAFGWTFVNTRVLADEIARKGQFRVYLPDFLDGNVAPLYLLDVFSKLATPGISATLTKP